MPQRTVAMEQPDDPVANAFLRILGTGDGAHAGLALASVCRDITRTLDPVLGKRGVAALFKRSWHLVQGDHPWLAAVHDDASSEIDFDAIASVFDAQAGGEAALAGASLLRAFCRLLATLVGASLTERLLRPVLFNLSGGKAAQDASS